MANCQHNNLQFSSGDYYVGCINCHAVWMRKGDRPEYGTDSQGNQIGADPSKCQPGFSSSINRTAQE